MCKHWSLGEFVCTLNIRRKMRIENMYVQKKHFATVQPSSGLSKDGAYPSSQILRKFFANLRRRPGAVPKHLRTRCEQR